MPAIWRGNRAGERFGRPSSKGKVPVMDLLVILLIVLIVLLLVGGIGGPRYYRGRRRRL